MDRLELRLEVSKPWFLTGVARVRVRINGVDDAVSPTFEISAWALERSAAQPGAHFIVNCSCGDPGCAHAVPVNVSSSGDAVVWTGSELMRPGQSELRFDAAQYRGEISRLCEELRAARRANPKLELACEDGFA